MSEERNGTGDWYCHLRQPLALSNATSRPALLLPILAISWFWLFGATIVSGLPVLAKDVLFANERVVTLMLALFAIGVGAGSMLAERLLHGEVSARHVPFSAWLMPTWRGPYEKTCPLPLAGDDPCVG